MLMSSGPLTLPRRVPLMTFVQHSVPASYCGVNSGPEELFNPPTGPLCLPLTPSVKLGESAELPAASKLSQTGRPPGIE